MKTMHGWTWVVLAALALTIAACDSDGGTTGGGDGEVDQLKQALPTAEEMTIRMPSSDFLVLEQSQLYRFTREITLHVSLFVREITNLVEDVVELPPTETDGESYAVWGPHRAPLSPAVWRVRVDRKGVYRGDTRRDLATRRSVDAAPQGARALGLARRVAGDQHRGHRLPRRSA